MNTLDGAMRRTKWSFVALLSLVTGCSAGGLEATPLTPHADAAGRYAIDNAWSRLGTMNDPSLAAELAVSRQSARRRPPPTTDSALDWQFLVDAPLNETPALYVSGTAEDNATDRMFATGGKRGFFSVTYYFYAFENLYGTSPTVVWQKTIDSAVDGSAIALTPDATKVFAVTKKGTVYGFNTADGSAATGFPVSLGNKVSWSSPWIDFLTQPYPLYVGDVRGHVTRIDSSTGAKLTSVRLCTAIHSSPIVWNGVVWAGCDDGSLHRLDPQTMTEFTPATKLCATATCRGNDAIYSAPFVDSIGDRLLVGVNNQVAVVDISAATGCTTGPAACPVTLQTVGKSAIFYSSPFIDFAAGYVYIAFNNALWRASYDGTAITSPFVAASHPLAGTNADAGYPKSSPLAFDGHVWVGDGGGFVNRYSTDGFAFENATEQYGVSIDTTPLIDVAGGNIYFGTNGTTTIGRRGRVNVDETKGSWVQLTQTW
jgi:outer membrane protein assembly factor BamB